MKMMGKIIDNLIHDNEKEEYDELLPILTLTISHKPMEDERKTSPYSKVTDEAEREDK